MIGILQFAFEKRSISTQNFKARKDEYDRVDFQWKKNIGWSIILKLTDR